MVNKNWSNDLDFFSKKCPRKRPHRTFLSDEKLKGLEKEALEEKADNIEQVSLNKAETLMTKSIHDAADVSREAILREVKNESIMEEQEGQRETKELLTLEKQLNNEKEKEKCIQKALKKKARAQEKKA